MFRLVEYVNHSDPRDITKFLDTTSVKYIDDTNAYPYNVYIALLWSCSFTPPPPPPANPTTHPTHKHTHTRIHTHTHTHIYITYVYVRRRLMVQTMLLYWLWHRKEKNSQEIVYQPEGLECGPDDGRTGWWANRQNKPYNPFRRNPS